MEQLRIIIGVGSNYGDRRRAVESAINWLKGILKDMQASGVYETPAYGHAGGPYMNAVVSGRLDGMALNEIETLLKQYEREHGRDDEARQMKRVPIDLDIVMAGSEILRPADYNCSFFRIGYQQLYPEE